MKPGIVTLSASATMFGVTKVDTLQYHVGWPLAAMIYCDSFPGERAGQFL